MVSKTDHPKVTFVSHKAGLTDHACPNKHISNCMVDHQIHGALTKTKLFNVNNVCNGIVCHSNSLHAAVSQIMDSDVEIHPVCISLCWRSKLKLDFYAQRYIQIKNQIKCLSSITRGVVTPSPEPEAHVLSVRAFRVEMEFLEMLVSEERGKPEYPGGKPLGAAKEPKRQT